MKQSFKAPLLMLVCIALTGCGFHPRGSMPATSVESAHVVSNGSIAIAGDLERALSQAGIDVAADRSNAQLTVILVSDQSRRQTVSVTPQVRTAEFEIAREVTFRVESAAGEVLLDDRAIAGSRVYRVDSTNLVGSRQQEALLATELTRDLGAQILRGVEAAARR